MLNLTLGVAQFGITHAVSNLALMLNLTLGVPSQASQSVKSSISSILLLNLALVELKKDYSERIFIPDSNILVGKCWYKII
jgi:hypothetical protein